VAEARHYCSAEHGGGDTSNRRERTADIRDDLANVGPRCMHACRLEGARRALPLRQDSLAREYVEAHRWGTASMKQEFVSPDKTVPLLRSCDPVPPLQARVLGGYQTACGVCRIAIPARLSSRLARFPGRCRHTAAREREVGRLCRFPTVTFPPIQIASESSSRRVMVSERQAPERPRARGGCLDIKRSASTTAQAPGCALARLAALLRRGASVVVPSLSGNHREQRPRALTRRPARHRAHARRR
jgi:hypothetical protein